jgi:molybdopterin synthase sulfur carrier subunit
MVTKGEITPNDVVTGVDDDGPHHARPGRNGTWVYRPPVATRGMEVEFVSYATVRDAIGEKSVTLAVPDGTTVGDALQELAAEHDGLDALLFESGGDLRPHVNVLVDDENVRSLDGQATTLADGDTVALAPGVSGGATGGDFA